MAEVATITVKNAAGATVDVPTLLSIEEHMGENDETAPASDIATVGLNGRLQRIAQRITTLIALFPTSIGAKAAAASLSVTLATDSAGITTQGRAAASASLPVVTASDMATSATLAFTPAAASHVAGDCNGAAGEFALMGPSAGRIMITSSSLMIAGGTAEATAWRLYLYNVTPPSATADDGTWDLASGDRTAFLGYIDLGTAVDLGSTQWVETHGHNKEVKLAGTGLFGYLVNLTTLTPAAVAHTVTLNAVVL